MQMFEQNKNRVLRTSKAFRLVAKHDLTLRGVTPRFNLKKKYRFQLQRYFATMVACGFPSVAVCARTVKSSGVCFSHNTWLWSATALTGLLGLSSVYRFANCGVSGGLCLNGETRLPSSWFFFSLQRSARVVVTGTALAGMYNNAVVAFAAETRNLLGLGWGRSTGLTLRRLQSGPRWFRLLRRLPICSRIVIRRRRNYFRFRKLRLRRNRIRVPQWIWWRFRPRWHGYWLIKRKWKYQKKFIPVRKMKFAVTLRRAKWVVHARRVALYTQFRNPVRGQWWKSAATYPKRRKYISAGMLRRRLFKERVFTMRQTVPFFNWFYFVAERGGFNFNEPRVEEEDEVPVVKNMFFLSDGTEVEDWTKGRPDELTPDDLFNGWFKDLYKRYKLACMPVDDGLPVYDYMHATLDNLDTFDNWRLGNQDSKFFYTAPWALEYIEPKWMKDLAKPKTVMYGFGRQRFGFGFRFAPSFPEIRS